jgi:hypothetical protein
MMIRRHHEPFRSQPRIPISERDPETLGAQILKVSSSLEALVREGKSLVRAVDALLAEPGEYDPILAAAFRELPVAGTPYELHTVRIRDLTLRMLLAEEVRTTNGTLLVCKGVEITDILLARLWSFHERQAIGDSFRVLVPVSVRLA